MYHDGDPGVDHLQFGKLEQLERRLRRGLATLQQCMATFEQRLAASGQASMFQRTATPLLCGLVGVWCAKSDTYIVSPAKVEHPLELHCGHVELLQLGRGPASAAASYYTARRETERHSWPSSIIQFAENTRNSERSIEKCIMMFIIT